jgi:BirA family transcriptional regulator, biotin operon repressor / biotin---[acetyl-CoA-carboxylase] ligase
VTGLTSERIEPLLRGRLGRPYVHEAECETTQNLLAGDAPEGAVATADHQRAGRGRHGRRWDDEPGSSLLVSVVLRPPASAGAAQLSLVCALSVAETVDHAAALEALVKWPNDVLVEGRKIAGILLEGRDGAVVCGIGINVNQLESALPAQARTPAASLRTLTGREHDRALVLVELLARLEENYDAWLAAGLVSLAPDLDARDALRGREVSVGDIVGTAAGIAPDGRLRIARADSTVTLVASGEIEVT